MMQKLTPSRINTQEGKERRLGVEIEFAGVEPSVSVNIIKSLYGGDEEQKNIFDHKIRNSKLGDFQLELDSSQMKTLGEKLEWFLQDSPSTAIELAAMPVLAKVAEAFVPWEIVTSPIAMSQLSQLFPLVSQLREQGALGTRHALHYAFGLHLNPELPDISADTILAYLRAYFCLYDWIYHCEAVDFMRKVTPYVRHFPADYIDKVIALNYKPTIDELIADYLHFNPTRNRSLDMLPLFAFINEGVVKQAVDDPRIKSRPTFHYRLPNCDIDNPQWNIDYPWRLWLLVEEIANDATKLDDLCIAYSNDRQRLTHAIDNGWKEQLQHVLALER
jgi:hypothetical protein